MSFMNLLQSGLSSLAQNNGANQMNGGNMVNQMSGMLNQMGTNGGGLGQVLNCLLNAAGGKNNIATLLGVGGLGALLTSGLDKGTARGIGLLGAGALAYSLYQKYKGQNTQNPAMNQYMPNQNMSNQMPYQNAQYQNMPNNQALSAEQELIIKAVVFAVRADGMIDANERQCMCDLISKILPNTDANSVISAFLEVPIDPSALARQVSSKEQAGEIYALSCMVIDIDHYLERGYLDALSKELGLDSNQTSAIENEIANSKKQMRKEFA